MADDSARAKPRRWAAGAVVVLVLAAFALTVTIGLVRGSAGTAEIVTSSAPDPTGSATVAPDIVYVHVAGEVAAPGLYGLPPTARVADALAAAGGFAADADRAAVNLARTVQDGEQILVPVVGAPPPPDAAASGADTLVNLNSADAAELDRLPGIGPALAGRILAWREENGPFAGADDLLAVPGIGEKLVAGLRDLVRV